MTYGERIWQIGMACAFLVSLTYILIVLYGVGSAMLDRVERHECLKLQAWSKDYQMQEFYITGYEKDMCDHHNIDIDAPVKRSTNP